MRVKAGLVLSDPDPASRENGEEMPELFVAPIGAMQFEITDPKTGDYCGSRFWVLPIQSVSSVKPKETRNWQCDCTRWFEVLLDTLPPHLKPAFSGDGGFAVCLCVGRVVE